MNIVKIEIRAERSGVPFQIWLPVEKVNVKKIEVVCEVDNLIDAPIATAQKMIANLQLSQPVNVTLHCTNWHSQIIDNSEKLY